MSDKVTLVNEQDEVVGSMDKVAAHRGAAQLHRAISVYLFRRNPQTRQLEVLLQQRSSSKIVGAGQWANTACGNVWPGESYLECAQRRLLVELGITADHYQLSPIEKFKYQVQCSAEFSEHEMDQVFAGWFSGEVNPNPAEVAAYQWFEWSQIVQESDQLQVHYDWAPWFEIMLNNKVILQEINKFLEK